MQKLPFFLAGSALTPNQNLKVYDKYTGECFAAVSQAGTIHVERAIAAGTAAKREMSSLTAWERKRILGRCVDQISQLRSEFVETLIVEAGKPRTAAELEVDRCIETFSLAAEESIRAYGDVLPLDGSPRGGGYMGFTKHVPVGLCSFITPFNFPLNLVAHKIAPAIAAGCPFILKPASFTPVSSLLLGNVLQDSGLPVGAFSILPSSRADAMPLVSDPRIAFLSFTGSESVGWQLKAQSGTKRVCLELGGNATCILDDGYDYESVVPRIAQAAFGQSGQSCISVQRLMIHHNQYERVVDEIVRVAALLPVGDPSESATVIGPMISSEEVDRILGWIASAKNAGARELLEAKRISPSVLTPSILDNVPDHESLSCDEAFGPVLITESYRDFEEAIDRVNASRFGLQTGIFTHDIRKASLAWDRLDVGCVVIGDTPNTRFDSMPYGGTKASGTGREGVRYAIREMTDERLMIIKP